MSIIDKTYFRLEAAIPDGEYSIVTDMITRYEPEILRMVMGPTLYQLMKDNASDAIYTRITAAHDYTEEYDGATHTVYWNGLANTELISLIAYYVYFQWVKNRVTMTVYTGEIKPLSENSEQAPVSAKMSYAWRLMKDLIGQPGDSIIKPTLYNLLTKYESDYPTWVFQNPGFVNSFDL